MLSSRALTISVLASFAYAQGVSQNCSNSLASVASNPDAAACLSPSSLIPIFLGDGNTPLIDPINTWLTTMCGAQSCSNDTLAAIVTNVTAGCASELSALGYTQAIQPMVTSAIQTYYPTARKVVCLKDNDDNGANCITQYLTKLQDVIGNLTVNNVISFIGGGGVGVNASAIDSQNLTCSNCVKEVYNIVKQDVPGLLGNSDDAAESLQAQCGASFVDGNTPSSISQTAASNTDPKNSGTLSLLASSGALALVVISSVFTFLG